MLISEATAFDALTILALITLWLACLALALLHDRNRLRFGTYGAAICSTLRARPRLEVLAALRYVQALVILANEVLFLLCKALLSKLLSDDLCSRDSSDLL